MAWNVGATSENGLWVGGENIITRDLTFFVDPGNSKCYNNGSSTATVTDLAQGEAMTKSGAGWSQGTPERPTKCPRSQLDRVRPSTSGQTAGRHHDQSDCS